jgi:hypothetical protein
MLDRPATVFVSYSHSDTEFVDQLYADLQMRGFPPWIDSHKLKGGQDWLYSIQQAIEQCQVLLLVLSPDAIDSKYVRMEYYRAFSMEKLVIPLLYRDCLKVWIGLDNIQWIDFTKSYDNGRNDLLDVLSPFKTTEPVIQAAFSPPGQSQAIFTPEEKEPELVAPQPAPTRPGPEIDDLYQDGVKARSEGDLERAVVLWQQIVERDPDFKSGTFKAQINTLVEKLRPSRVQRLRERAEEASKVGEWGQEISMWDLLLTLEPDDPQAKRRRELAQKNRKYDWHYENALQYAKEGSLPLAQTELEILWDAVPFYGDPQQLTKKIGIKVKVSSPADFDKLEEEKAKKEKQAAILRWEEEESKTINGFVEVKLETKPYVIWIALLCLLSGIGSAVGMLAQSWYWSVGAVVAVLILAYRLGYRRAIHLFIAIVITVVGCVIAFGLARYAATFSTTSQTSDIWLIGRHLFWDGRQVIFGLLIGAASALMMFFVYPDEKEDIFQAKIIGGAGMGLFMGLFFWAILACFSTLLGWGFGFGAGWYISLIALVVGVISGVGLGASIIVCAIAFDLDIDQFRNI